MSRMRGGDKPVSGSAVPRKSGSKLDRPCPVCKAKPKQKCFKTGANNYGTPMSHQHPQR